MIRVERFFSPLNFTGTYRKVICAILNYISIKLAVPHELCTKRLFPNIKLIHSIKSNIRFTADALTGKGYDIRFHLSRKSILLHYY